VATPSVNECRPLHCPRCRGRDQVDGTFWIVSHGFRSRFVIDLERVVCELELRRFRCRHCELRFTVGPADLAPRRQYTMAAGGLAVGLWVVLGWPEAEIRKLISPDQHQGDCAQYRWLTVVRWARRLLGVGTAWSHLLLWEACMRLCAAAAPAFAACSVLVRLVAGWFPTVANDAAYLTFIESAQSPERCPPNLSRVRGPPT